MSGLSSPRPHPPSQALTTGEARLARSIFGTALDVAAIRIHDRPYFPGQGKGVAMSPDGEIWFRAEDHKPDFSRIVGDAAWLTHELTHVWQYQTGRSVRVRGLFEQAGRLFGGDPYRYGALDADKAFVAYGNEQQAAIVEDYFRLTQKLKPRFGEGELAAYRAVIPFLPHRGRRLHRSTR